MGVYLGSQSVNLKGGQPSTSPTPSGGGEPKNVNFYDYEGTLLQSYTTSEWASVTELPANPTHEGLTAQGWNWSKADIDDYISDYPEATVNVGQMYITDDGKTRIYVHFEKDRTSPYLGLGVNGTVEIDWGDESATDTLTGTSLTSTQYIRHIYQPGDYVIKLNSIDGSFAITGNTSYNFSFLFKRGLYDSYQYYSLCYLNSIIKVELGNNVYLQDSAFGMCSNLSTILIPKGITSLPANTFQYCYSLQSVIISNDVTNIGNRSFRLCTSIRFVSFPNNENMNLGVNMFGGCSSLTSFTIPSKANVISSMFSSCNSLVSFIAPNNVEASAFESCNNLSDIYIGGTTVGSGVFSNDSSLNSITFSDKLTSIGSSAFQRCGGIISIVIPDNVTSIGANAFNYCGGIVGYHFLPITPPTLENSNAFSNNASDRIIYVPNESVDAYKTATNWSTYASQIQGE